MFEQRQTCRQKTLLSAVAVLLLLVERGRSAVLMDKLRTTETPLSNSSLITQLNNSSMEIPAVLPLHRPCGRENDTYCANGGTCMYPQDSDKAFCICKHPFSGSRCMFFDPSHTIALPDAEQVIGIIFGIFILIIFLAIAVYFLARKRCTKFALPMKSLPSETSV